MEELDLTVQHSWFEHWHRILDEVTGEMPGFDLEGAIAEPDANFRMHFVTWDLPDDDLRRCFDIFSCGENMVNRAIEFRALCRGTPPEISEAQALEHATAGLAGYASLLANEELQTDVKVVRGPREELDTRISRTNNMYELLEDLECSDPLAAEINDFLSETLYRLASSYNVAEYVLWPLYVDPNSVDPQRHFAILDLSDRYSARLAEDGPTLFVRTD